MERLGRHLRRNRILTSSQLQDGLQLQVIFGVRLGTSLVECGHLTLDQLSHHLSAQTGLPEAPIKWLEKPDPKAMAVLPVELVRSHSALPMHFEKGTLHVATLDQATRDALARSTDLRIQGYIVPELRLFYWLQRHLGIRRDVRYIDLGLEDESELVQPTRKPPQPREKSHEEVEREALGILPLEPDEDLLDERVFSQIFREFVANERPELANTRAEELPLDAPSKMAALEAHLASAPDRRSVADLAVQLASCFARVVGFFAVHHDLIQGYHGSGAEVRDRIEGILLPTTLESTLAHVVQTGAPYRGEPAKGEVDERLLQALGRKDVQQVGVIPVVHDGRVVNLLYADNESHALGATSFAALEALCLSISATYDRLIQNRRIEIES